MKMRPWVHTILLAIAVVVTIKNAINATSRKTGGKKDKRNSASK